MAGDLRRRRFLQSASALGLGAGLGAWPGLGRITPARAADLAVGPDAVRFRPEIEPVVRWIEETPRDQAMEVGHRPAQGRAVVPRPALGPVPGGHPQRQAQAGRVQVPRGPGDQLGPPARARRRPSDERLLPLLWALDNFKNSQAQDVKEGDWTLGKVDEAKVPGPDAAGPAFVKAMEAWDADGADVAAAGLCRASGAAGTMEPFWRYRRPRPARHRPQGDLRRPVLADPPGDRLAARRAGPPLARLRDARPPGRRPARRRRPLRGQPRAGQEDPRRLAGRQARPRPPPSPCWRRSARPRPRPPRPRPPACSTGASRPTRSGTPWSSAAPSC